MRQILLVFVTACSMESPPATRPAPAAPARAAPAADAAAPAVTTAPRSPGPDVPTISSAIDCSAGDAAFAGLHEAAIYCAHVQDPCCTENGWVCNNARYIDWFAEQCRK